MHVEWLQFTTFFTGKRWNIRAANTSAGAQSSRYTQVSAIASEVTGTRWNGLAFFGLTGERRKGAARDVTANR
jgi:hypothetical protein